MNKNKFINSPGLNERTNPECKEPSYENGTCTKCKKKWENHSHENIPINTNTNKRAIKAYCKKTGMTRRHYLKIAKKMKRHLDIKVDSEESLEDRLAKEDAGMAPPILGSDKIDEEVAESAMKDTDEKILENGSEHEPSKEEVEESFEQMMRRLRE